MKSKELFYILIIIILILNVLNKKETFLNLRRDHKKIQNNKNNKNNKNNLKKQFQGKFKNIKEFYEKRPKFEEEYGKKLGPFEQVSKRIQNLKNAIKKKDYVLPFNKNNKKYGKPGFYL